MHKIEDNLTQVNLSIQQAAVKAERNPKDVTLLAVSKTQSADAIRTAFHAGQRNFGENYLQEALSKQAELSDLDICWHFIGPIQSNKTKAIAENFSWVHSLDRIKIAQKLSDQRKTNMPPLNICIQVNIDREETKSGVYAEKVIDFAEHIQNMPGIQLRGLMTIPQPRESKEQLARFGEMHALLLTLKSTLGRPEIDTLSMGMSADVNEAIQAGATIVRIGTNIFGSRR